MNKKLTFVAMLAMALTLGACNSRPDSSSSDSGTSNPTSSATPTTSDSTTTAPTPSTSVTPTTSVTPDPSTVTPSTSTPAPSTSTPTPVEEHKVVLPEIDGLSIRASSLTPDAGEEVTLYVSTSTAKRLDAITLNGSSLELKESNQKGTKICKFAMPEDADAVIEATVVNVYAIKVADEVKDSFGIVCDVTSAAEGETVTFKAASYAGYWFKAVVALEEDVALQPNEDGSYSFSMPGHSVTISATTGENVYSVTWDTEDCSVRVYHYVPSSSDPEKMLQSYLSQGDAVAVGTELYFKVSDSGKVKTVDKVSFNGAELTANEDGEYVVTMPTYPVKLNVTMKDHVRYLSSEGSEHFNVKLTKMVTEDDVEKEVEATTALYGDKIYITAIDKTPNVSHKFVVSAYNLFYGNTAENVTNTSSSYKVSTDSDGRYYFTVGEYEYTHVTITEIESAFKGTAIPGTYTGYKGYYSTTATIELKEAGTGRIDGSNYKNATAAESGKYELTQDTTYSPKTAYIFASEKENYTALLVDTNGPAISGRAETFVVSKGLGSFDMNNTFTYMFAENSKVKKQYIHAAFADGAVDVFYDDSEGVNKAYFDVTINHISGDGKTVGDKIAIMNGDKTLATFEITKIESKGNGYQHAVKEITSDGFEGTYKNGESSLVLNGFGGATLDGAAGTYTVDKSAEKKVVVTIGGAETAYTLNTDDKTFAADALPTDGYDGTYNGADGALVLDGYGAASLAGATGTYTLDGSVITITIGEDTHTYELDKDNLAYANLSSLSGLTFKGSYDTRLDDTYTLVLTFNKSSKANGTLTLGYQFKFGFNGTFDASSNTLTMTITSADDTSLISKVITATVNCGDDGAIESITFNDNINDNVYNIGGVTATLAA